MLIFGLEKLFLLLDIYGGFEANIISIYLDFLFPGLS